MPGGTDNGMIIYLPDIQDPGISRLGGTTKYNKRRKKQMSNTATAEKKYKIRLPKTKEMADDVFVSVNDRSWLIKRGEEVELPECAYEVLRNQELALLHAYEYSEAAEKK